MSDVDDSFTIVVALRGGLKLPNEQVIEDAAGSVDFSWVATLAADPDQRSGSIRFGKHSIALEGHDRRIDADLCDITVGMSRCSEEEREQFKTHDSHYVLRYAGVSTDAAQRWLALYAVALSFGSGDCVGVLNAVARTFVPPGQLGRLRDDGTPEALVNELPIGWFTNITAHEVAHGCLTVSHGYQEIGFPNFACLTEDSESTAIADHEGLYMDAIDARDSFPVAHSHEFKLPAPLGTEDLPTVYERYASTDGTRLVVEQEAAPVVAEVAKEEEEESVAEKSVVEETRRPSEAELAMTALAAKGDDDSGDERSSEVVERDVDRNIESEMESEAALEPASETVVAETVHSHRTDDAPFWDDYDDFAVRGGWLGMLFGRGSRQQSSDDAVDPVAEEEVAEESTKIERETPEAASELVADTNNDLEDADDTPNRRALNDDDEMVWDQRDRFAERWGCAPLLLVAAVAAPLLWFIIR